MPLLVLDRYFPGQYLNIDAVDDDSDIAAVQDTSSQSSVRTESMSPFQIRLLQVDQNSAGVFRQGRKLWIVRGTEFRGKTMAPMRRMCFEIAREHLQHVSPESIEARGRRLGHQRRQGVHHVCDVVGRCRQQKTCLYKCHLFLIRMISSGITFVPMSA